MNGDPRPRAPVWAMAATAGSTLVGMVVMGIFLDIEFGWTPWATLVGLALGFVSCMSILLRAANQSKSEPPE